MTERRRPQVTVIGSADADPAMLDAAEASGRVIAGLPAVLVTGGRGGVMEAASQGAAAAGGLVVGILPGADHAAANPWCSVVIPTGMGQARNLPNVLAGDAVVVVGGAAGTLSELAFAWRFGRPCLAWTTCGGVAAAWAGKRLDNSREGSIIPIEDVAGLETALRRVLAAFFR